MNIFAEELASVLSNHEMTLSNLYQLRIPYAYDRDNLYLIRPNKVSRLIKSLKKDMTATLNADELEALQGWTPLDPEGLEMRRLRAALVAEGVRHLLAGRMAAEQASDLGARTLAMLLDETGANNVVDNVRGPEDVLFFDVYSRVRGPMSLLEDSPAGADDDSSEAIEQALEPAIETLEQGVLWLEIARETADSSTRLGMVSMSTALLTAAYDLLTHAPGIALDTPQQSDLLMAIEAARREASYL